MIVAKPRDLNIAVVTRGGVTTGAEHDKQQEQPQPQVRPAVQKKESPIGQKHKQIFWDVQS